MAEHGRGVFVRPRPPVRRLASDRFARRHREQGKTAFIADSEASGRVPSVDMIKVAEERPPEKVATLLGIRPRDRVIVRRRRYLSDGQPVEFATSYIPASLARGTKISDPNPGPGGIYARLEEMGHALDFFEEEITSRMPTPEEVRMLRMAPGVPVFGLVRTAYDTDRRAVEVCDTIMSADAYTLSYRLPAR